MKYFMESRKIKILVIDDNKDNLVTMQALIKESFPNALILTAQSGMKGVELAKVSEPDIILLDIIMPDMDGFTVCKKLKTDNKLSDIPVVFITAIKGDKENRIKALETGGDAFITKPVDASELTAQIRAMVKISDASKMKKYEKDHLAKLVEERTEELNNTHIATLNLLEDLKAENERREKLMGELIVAKEKAEESDKLKTAFINNISHEIRTPLNGILGFGELLAELELTADERKQYYTIVKESSHRLMSTVSDYIDMARIVSGNMVVPKKEILLQPLFREIIENMEQLCCEKKIDFEAVIPTTPVDIILHSDGEYIRKTFNILFDNAIKFTQKGSIKCGYRILSGFLEFFVQDTGKGIANHNLEMIFKMFSQEDSSLTRGYEGSGLGLSIAQGLVKLLGGTITATSEIGKGSVFSFTIPYVEPAFSDKNDTAKAIESTLSNDPLVLIAEDEESNYLYLEVLMKMIGCNYILVTDGAQAVEKCKETPKITLVLMDIKMPVMNGLEATKLIREFRPGLPIIATTACAQTGDANHLLAAGCDGYLPKPIKKENLLQLLQKYA